jgi:hypothetical protein
MWIYARLLRLYPSDVRYAYEREMLDSFGQHVTTWRRNGRAALALAIGRAISILLVDIAAERISGLYSHRSFHGPRKPDWGMVRPPNVSKAEWFSAVTSDADTRT